jgi:type IV secretion system protein TrbL
MRQASLRFRDARHIRTIGKSASLIADLIRTASRRQLLFGAGALVLAVIVGIGTNLFNQFTQGFGGNQPTVNDVLAMALAALTLLGLGIFGPSIATGIAAGAPQLGAGAAVGTAAAIYGVGRAAPATVLATGGAAVRAGRGVASVISGRAFSSSNGGNGGPAGGSGSPPAWARRMQRQQAMSQGLGAMSRALRSGERGGASTSVNLRGEDR